MKRADGRLQVTYNHHPLYTFVKDTGKGQTNGEDIDAFGAEWYAVSAAGAKVEKTTPRAAAAATRRRAATAATGTRSRVREGRGPLSGAALSCAGAGRGAPPDFHRCLSRRDRRPVPAMVEANDYEEG